VLTVKPLRFRTADGDVDLNLRFTPFTAKSPPRLGAEIDVRHIDLHKFLRNQSSDLVKQTAGTVGGFVKIDSNGVSLRELLARMNGDAGFFMENGQVSDLLQRLAPIDVLGALGVYASGDKPVPINCLVSRFAISDGVASLSTLLLDTNDTQISGEGAINFASEGLSLSFKPQNKHFTLVSLRAPVDVGGTLAKPNFNIKAGELVARLGAATGLGILFPPAALLPLVDTGLGEKNACSAAYAAQQPPGNPQPRSDNKPR
jgi:AsmA family protein